MPQILRVLKTDSTDSVVESVSGGMGMGTVVTAGVAGLVAGAVLQEVRWKRRIDEAEKSYSPFRRNVRFYE